MKKILSFLVIGVMSLFFLVSCSKSTPTPPAANANPIVGLWVGTYQTDGAASLGEFYYGCNVFADGTIVQQGGGGNGSAWASQGTWTLHDSLFTATITGTDLTPQYANAQVITAIYDSVAGTLSNGKWHYTSGRPETGTFSLKRVK